jgi:putative nucleotidyltransferase with HDIG domain
MTTSRSQKTTLHTEKSNTQLILLFSQRERIRDILTIGLLQSNYQVTQAETAYVTTIKAYQFIPDLIIADITRKNTKDISIISRIKKTARLQHVHILLIIQQALLKELKHNPDAAALYDNQHELLDTITTISLPFNFEDLQAKVKKLLHVDQEQPQHESPKESKSEILEKLYDASVSTQEKLMYVENALQQQWAFPFTVIKAMDIIESDSSCCKELGTCISTDMGASSAILKVANTVHFAGRNKSVSDVTDAVVRLGFRETRNLLSCLALINLTSDTELTYGFRRQDFWLHSLCCALISEKLCRDINHKRPEMAFIAGLLHDLGKIPIDNYFHTLFTRELEESANTITPFYDTEKRLVNFSHADLGHYLTYKWNIPHTIALAILNHHHIENILKATPPYTRIVQEAVFVANILAKALAIGHSCDDFIREIPAQILRELQIPRGPSERFLFSVFKNLRTLCNYLNLSTTRIPHTLDVAEDAPCVVVVMQKNVLYHPLISALTKHGYHVKITNKYDPEEHAACRVIVSLTEKGYPLDIMLDDDEETTTNDSPLRIFLLEKLPGKEFKESFENSNIMFIQRDNVNVHLILHTVENFLQKDIALPSSGEDH